MFFRQYAKKGIIKVEVSEYQKKIEQLAIKMRPNIKAEIPSFSELDKKIIENYKAVEIDKKNPFYKDSTESRKIIKMYIIDDEKILDTLFTSEEIAYNSSQAQLFDKSYLSTLNGMLSVGKALIITIYKGDRNFTVTGNSSKLFEELRILFGVNKKDVNNISGKYISYIIAMIRCGYIDENL